MDSADKIGLMIILLVSLIIAAFSFANVSVSGYSVVDLVNTNGQQDNEEKSLMLLTFLLVTLTVVSVIFAYILHSRSD